MGSTGPPAEDAPSGTVVVQVDETAPHLHIPMFHGFPHKRRVVPIEVARMMPKRRHGFHRPWHLLQVASWVLLLGFFVVVVVMVLPFLPSFWEYLAYGVFSSGYVIIIWANYKACMTDPVDQGTTYDENTNCYIHDAVPSVKCTVCKAWIRAESKHCKPCNKCVSDFDHHCKWLNTCVGATNYLYFFIFLSVTLLLATLLLAVLSWVMADTYKSTGRYKKLLDENLNGMDLTSYRVALMCLLALDVLAWLLLAELFKFHGQLSMKKVTTYEWIMATRKSLLMQSVLTKAAAPPSEAELDDLGAYTRRDEEEEEEEDDEEDCDDERGSTHPPTEPTKHGDHEEAPTPTRDVKGVAHPEVFAAKLDLLMSPPTARRLPPLGSS